MAAVFVRKLDRAGMLSTSLTVARRSGMASLIRPGLMRLFKVLVVAVVVPFTT